MTPMDLTQLKSAMSTAGFPVSDGDGWTVEDTKQYRDYCYHKWNNMVPDRDLFALAYPGLAPAEFPGAGDDPAPVEPVLETIAISGDDTVVEGATVDLTATGTYDDESTEDLTADATWTSSDDEVATVEEGIVTGVAEGTAQITASFDGVDSDPFDVTVTAAE